MQTQPTKSDLTKLKLRCDVAQSKLKAISEKEDKVIKTQSGLTYPILWLSDKVAIYRISTDQESADYAISLDGGEAKKIRDVTKTSGIDRWYYYR